MLSKSLEETRKIAENFLNKIEPKENEATIFGLHGDLGSGKTTFTQLVGEMLGVEEKIQSPTFIIMKSYKTRNNEFGKLIHIDAYRLNKGEDIEKLGWKEIVSNPKNLILVEWPEKIKEVMPKKAVKINFSFKDENTREIEINY